MKTCSYITLKEVCVCVLEVSLSLSNIPGVRVINKGKETNMLQIFGFYVFSQ